jgi:hypothetical protein
MTTSALAAALGFAAVAQAEPGQTAALRAPTTFTVEMGPAGLPRGLATQMEAAATAGLVAAGATVLPRSPSPPPGSCPNGAACAHPTTGPGGGAITLLRGTCQLEGSTYRVHLELVDTRSGSVLMSRDDLCEICTEKDVTESTNIAASALKAALDQARTRAPRVPAIVAAPAAAPVALDLRDQDHRRPPGHFLRRAAPWIAVGAGAYAIGAGIYFLSLSGKETNYNGDLKVNTRIYDTTRQGLIWLGAGAAVAAAGMVFVIRDGRETGMEPIKHSGSDSDSSSPPSPSASSRRPVGIAVSPSGLAAWGMF